MTNQFARELTKISGPIEKKHIEQALDALDVDWAELTPKQRTRVFQAANRALLPLETKIPKAVTVPIDEQTTTIVKGTRREVRKEYKLKIGAKLNETDERIAKFVAESQPNFIRDEYGRRRKQFSRQARAIVAEGVGQGIGRREMAEDLERRLGYKVTKSRAYWEVVASTFANRARSWAQMSSFEEAGIERYIFEAVLDKATTDTCRFLHGKKFQTSAGLAKFREVERRRDPEAIKEVTPWVRTVKREDGTQVLAFDRDGERVEVATVVESAVGQDDETGKFSSAMSNNQLMQNGLTMPPLHGLCRSTVVADV